MSDKFDLSAYRHATIGSALLEEAQKLVGEPWEAKQTGLPGRVGAVVTVDMDGGISLHGIIEEVNGDTMSGKIVEVFETPPPPDDDEWD